MVKGSSHYYITGHKLVPLVHYEYEFIRVIPRIELADEKQKVVQHYLLNQQNNAK